VLCARGYAKVAAAFREVRESPRGDPKLRGGSSKLTSAKHVLREWIESALISKPFQFDENALAQSLNESLSRAGLFEKAAKDDDSEWSGFGSLGDKVGLRRKNEMLILTTTLGILCGVDQSAYIYRFSQNRWRRVWEVERNTYTEREYQPQVFTGIQISERTSEPLVLTLGTNTWCSSNWHFAHFRLYRIGQFTDTPTGSNSRPIVDRSRIAYIGNRNAIQGAIHGDKVTVALSVGSWDSVIHTSPAIYRYIIEGNSAVRVDPIALRPRDFVGEWLFHDWSAIERWTEHPELREWHDRLRQDWTNFEFPTKHCAAQPDLWQVGLGENPTVYFLVRWRPPYRFTMVDVRERPWPDCTEVDRMADEADTTFFPLGN
jgi:hypothetical protein